MDFTLFFFWNRVKSAAEFVCHDMRDVVRREQHPTVWSREPIGASETETSGVMLSLHTILVWCTVARHPY